MYSSIISLKSTFSIPIRSGMHVIRTKIILKKIDGIRILGIKRFDPINHWKSFKKPIIIINSFAKQLSSSI